jgi:hypothetical protein
MRTKLHFGKKYLRKDGRFRVCLLGWAIDLPADRKPFDAKRTHVLKSLQKIILRKENCHEGLFCPGAAGRCGDWLRRAGPRGKLFRSRKCVREK